MKLFKNILLAGSALLTVGCANSPVNSEEAFVEELLKKMTIEEKIGQMNQLAWGDWNEMARSGRIGSVLNILDIDEINEMQRCAVEESRLGIPVLFARDVIHGYKTMFPITSGQAATFNPELVE